MGWVNPCLRLHHAEHELPVRCLAIGGEINPNGDRLSDFAWMEPAGLAECAVQKGLPDLGQADGLATLPEPQIHTAPHAKALRHGRGVNPQPATARMGDDMNGRKPRCILNRPAAKKQARLLR